ncbi:MAG TPA: chemotaxis-specific protein-glutamate methyltransferase CheB [Anaerolineae bacterium]|nr:chemotaxis-specific protein-glutamate methyltransferase CheB [Anaerolineae bacterium]
MGRVIRVLVVDDSAYVRKVLRQILSRNPFIEVVGTAHDGEEALELVEELRPDVVTLDLQMPRMDGVAFLHEQMTSRPLPVVVVSVASEGGDMALEALDAGAVDFIHKPTALATDQIYEIGNELIAKVKAAAQAAPRLRLLQVAPIALAPLQIEQHAGRVDLIAIGVSTGGPQALRRLIPRLPADLPVPVAIVLHMPVGYTGPYAQRLDAVSPLRVVEAREGDEATPGTVLLAPAGRHLTLVRTAQGKVVAHLDVQPTNTVHRPSVDVLFRSVADVYGERALGIVLTGMGTDGRNGAAWIKAQGGLVYTEAEETCIVYGMPRAVVEAGLSDRSVPLNQMAEAILEVV